jgi:hypothetical protein
MQSVMGFRVVQYKESIQSGAGTHRQHHCGGTVAQEIASQEIEEGPDVVISCAHVILLGGGCVALSCFCNVHNTANAGI